MVADRLSAGYRSIGDILGIRMDLPRTNTTSPQLGFSRTGVISTHARTLICQNKLRVGALVVAAPGQLCY